MRRSVRFVSLPLLVALTASGALLTACGGDDDSDATASPTAWIDTVCGAVDGYVKAGVAAGNPAARANNASQKTAYTTFLDAVITAYGGAEQTLRAIGKPDIANGEQRQDEAMRLFQGSRTALEAQRGQLEALDPAAPDFPTRFAAVGRPLTEQTQLISAIFSDADLKDPVAQSQTCQSIMRSLGTP